MCVYVCDCINVSFFLSLYFGCSIIAGLFMFYIYLCFVFFAFLSFICDLTREPNSSAVQIDRMILWSYDMNKIQAVELNVLSDLSKEQWKNRAIHQEFIAKNEYLALNWIESKRKSKYNRKWVCLSECLWNLGKMSQFQTFMINAMGKPNKKKNMCK